jgi:hypothetical protein
MIAGSSAAPRPAARPESNMTKNAVTRPTIDRITAAAHAHGCRDHSASETAANAMPTMTHSAPQNQ